MITKNNQMTVKEALRYARMPGTEIVMCTLLFNDHVVTHEWDLENFERSIRCAESITTGFWVDSMIHATWEEDDRTLFIGKVE